MESASGAASVDDDVWESWEEMEDSGALDERLAKELHLRSRQIAEEGDDDGEERTKAKSQQAPVILQEDSIRTAYQPRLKILKRPTGPADAESNGETYGASRQDAAAKTKSLAEREAAYAEARKRIMGSKSSNYSDEDQRQALNVAKQSSSSTRTDGETNKRQSGKGKSDKTCFSTLCTQYVDGLYGSVGVMCTLFAPLFAT